MKKTTATYYDQVLSILHIYPNMGFNKIILMDMLKKHTIKVENIDELLAIFKADKLIKEYNTVDGYGYFNISDYGVKFIKVEGGYTKNRRFTNYAHTNIKFTWMRHWVWFITTLISFICNLYFIYTYLLKLPLDR